MANTKREAKSVVTFPLILAESLHDGLKKASQKNGRTMTSTINLLVKKYLDGKTIL